MPVSYAIDAERDLGTLTAWGDITVQEMIEAIAGILTDAAWHPGMKNLTDWTQATHVVSAADVKRLAALLMEHRDKLTGVRAALVAGKTVSYGMMRMLEAHVETCLELRVFYDVGEAHEWLGTSAPAMNDG